MVGNLRVCVGGSDQVESYHGLGDESIPFLGGKVRVARGKSGANVIFECADCTFCGVAAVGVQGKQVGSQRCICGRLLAWCGSNCCQECGEWGLHHDGIGVHGMYYRL